MEVTYDNIGINYNETRKADDYLSSRLLHHLNPKSNGVYLDIGCGTGNYTCKLQKQGFQFIGIDPSKEMLNKAKQKNQVIDWKLGHAEKNGLPKNSVDGIMASLTIHHWHDINMAYLEMARILKQNGKIVIFTSIPEQMKGYWLNHYFPNMLTDSINQMPTLKRVEKAMNQANIKITSTEKYFIKPDLQDQFLYCGKQNPELYFNEKIRHGISSFSSLANQSDVEQGLLTLRQDIDAGKINQIMRSYENNLGDYLYIVAEKVD